MLTYALACVQLVLSRGALDASQDVDALMQTAIRIGMSQSVLNKAPR
jgi:hypothetical protein